MKGGALEGKGKYSCLCLDIGFYNIIQLYINAIVRIMIEIKDIENIMGLKSSKAFQLFLKPENEPNNWTKWLW
jgi:hypothetical protein